MYHKTTKKDEEIMEKAKQETKTKQSPKTPKTVALDELNLVIKNAGNTELINETGNTVVCLLMQEDGKVMSSFLGNYNKEILNTLQHVNKVYFKKLKKELLKPKKQKTTIPTKTKEKETIENPEKSKETKK